jgi:FtsP/CotA-like multicopper oxidase with cupredoxin domain
LILASLRIAKSQGIWTAVSYLRDALDPRTTDPGSRARTVLVTPMGRVRIAFEPDNPGRWAFRCHNLYQMANGMKTGFRYQGIFPFDSPPGLDPVKGHANHSV